MYLTHYLTVTNFISYQVYNRASDWRLDVDENYMAKPEHSDG